MLLRVLHRDVQRNKVITAALFFFVALAALLTAGGTRVIGELTGAIDHLFAVTEVPSFIQMHTGEVSEAQVAEFARANSLVERAQVLPTVLVPGSSLYLVDGQSEANGVMDISFVTQSSSFDHLVNLENLPIQPRDGEIAVPVYYLQKNGLSVGDRVSVRDGSLQMDFTITDFVRDAAMNPSLASSKRFLISERDYRLMADHFGEAEHLIEFRLHDLSTIGAFTVAYQAAGMPQKGPTITYGTLKLLNALSDGLSAGVLLLISLLLMVTALLCLRFIILATLEEDVREIGTMKAIGIPYVRIRNLYLVKYVVLSAIACLIGYLLSFPASERFSANITLYMGRPASSWLRESIPLLAAGLCFLLVILFCQLVLRRCRRQSAVDSLRLIGATERRGKRRGLSLTDHGLPGANAFLAANEVLRRFESYVLLGFIFLLCTFIIIVPLNMLNTLESPTFATYLGAAQSDLRIDLQPTADLQAGFADIISHVQCDDDILECVPLVTSQFAVALTDGTTRMLSVESGDFSAFPLNYLSGHAPEERNEIALSYLNARELQKEPGDTLLLGRDDDRLQMTVCGVYQDIFNGGKTAKMSLSHNPETVRWYVINMRVKPGVSVADKVSEYAAAFPYAKVVDVPSYAALTVASILSQLRSVVRLALLVAAGLSVLITALFLKTLLAKERSEIAALKSIGFSSRDIRIQYGMRVLLLLGCGVIAGTLLANTLGQRLVGLALGGMGAPEIRFIINPAFAYLLCPLLLLATVTLTTLSSLVSVERVTVRMMFLE